MRRLVILLACLGLVGCGAVDNARQQAEQQVETVKKKAEQQVARVQRRLRRLRAKVARKVNRTLAQLERAVPRATTGTQVPTRRAATSFEKYMASVLDNLDGYWQKTFAAADLPRPRVARVFIAPGDATATGCGDDADDQAAFYCPADDTIYFGERLGKDVYDNIGDFGVAYALAHEYAHNIQQELGWFSAGTRLTTVAPFELQADCMAGTWGYAVYQEGRIDDADVSEALRTAMAVGDFDLTNPQHHGTPEERAKAWQTGYRSGDPSDCRAFLPS